MLQLKTIQQDTFELLKDLSTRNDLQSFALAGGTALALQLGHRISIDLDFFTDQKFDSFELFERHPLPHVPSLGTSTNQFYRI